MRSVAVGTFELVDLTADDLDRCSQLVERYADLPLGAADASVVAVAERLGVRHILTLDRTHFSVVRPRHVDHFDLLPVAVAGPAVGRDWGVDEPNQHVTPGRPQTRVRPGRTAGIA